MNNPKDNSRLESANKTPKKGSFSRLLTGCLLAVSAAVLMCVLALIAVVGFMIAGTALGTTSAPRTAQAVPLRDIHLAGPSKGPAIAVIDVEGMIYGSSFPQSELSPVSIISAKLDRARRDPEVKGVLLMVDSPGGSVTGADILYDQMRKLKEAPEGKPVVASVLNIAASGAYYGICGVDKIMAHPTSLTGSIGVLMPLYDATELMQKIGIKEESILSGDYKDTGSPFSDRGEDVKKRQRDMLKSIVEKMHSQFVETVADGRGLDREQVAEVADGRIFTAKEAEELKFIDAIGYESDAVEALSNIIDVQYPRIVQYRREVSLGALVSTLLRARSDFSGLEAIFTDKPPLNPRPMYLWTGEALE